MNCLEFRRLSLINPLDVNPARATHRQSCKRCAKYADQLIAQDELIREATRIEVPEGFAARILLNQSLQEKPRRPTVKYWLSLAASIAIAAVILPPIIRDAAFVPFESELIAHVSTHNVLSADQGLEHRDRLSGNHHFSASEHASQIGEVRQVLASIGAEMPVDADNILYASTCVVDGEVMAHLLMKDGDEEYVVFLMPQWSFARTFAHKDWIGQIIQSNDQSLAILNRRGVGMSSAAAKFSSQFGGTQTISQSI